MEPEVSAARTPKRRVVSLGLLLLSVSALTCSVAGAQPPPQNPPPQGPGRAANRVPPAPKKVGETWFGSAASSINTKDNEATVTGRMSAESGPRVHRLDQDGREILRERHRLDTDAVTFNLAMT